MLSWLHCPPETQRCVCFGSQWPRPASALQSGLRSLAQHLCAEMSAQAGVKWPADLQFLCIYAVLLGCFTSRSREPVCALGTVSVFILYRHWSSLFKAK